MEKINLRSVRNIRDFGGTETKDGHIIKSGMFVRSAALNKLTASDLKVLQNDYNIKTVIDLRTGGEVKDNPDQLPDEIDYVHISLLNHSVVGISHERGIDINREMPDMSRLYRNIVKKDYAINGLKQVMQTIYTASEKGGVLWHCTEGKDRCGIVSALFLSLLGVPRFAIYDDYIATNESAKKKAAKYYWLTRISQGRDAAEDVEAVYLADEQYLQAAFDYIEEKYGSVNVYLKNALEVTDEMRDTLRERCLIAKRK